MGSSKNKMTVGGSAAAHPFLCVGADVLIGPAGGCGHPPLRLIARAALVVCCDSPGPPPGHTARCAPPLPGPPPKPSGDGRGFGGERSRSGRSELCRLRRSEGSGACGEAKDLELAATLSRYAPSATGNCSLLRRKYRWTASSLFFGLRSSLLPCSRALHASILPHFRAKRKRGDSPRSFRAIYFASAVASTLPNSWPL